MTCRLSNDATQQVALKRLEIAVTRAGEPVYHLVWHLLYNASGGEHIRVTRDERIAIAGGSEWEHGVQFCESQAGVSNIWPAGTYEFQLLGWVDRRPGLDLPNLKTKFRAEVDAFIEREMTRWRHASAEEWDEQHASDSSASVSHPRDGYQAGSVASPSMGPLALASPIGPFDSAGDDGIVVREGWG